MVAEYYIIMTSYRWFKAEDSDLRFRYRLLAILGLITLFFTGNRTALLVILFALMFMCYRIGHKKTFFIIVLLLTALSVSILTDCDLRGITTSPLRRRAALYLENRFKRNKGQFFTGRVH